MSLRQKNCTCEQPSSGGVAMQENPSFAEYIAAQRFRCIELSNAYHSRRIELYDIRGDITTVRHKVEAAYVRLCIKENPRSDQM
ncbi:hypothetical protein J9231_00130 [Providencia rettgeri]|uniref:hypothetical protein n=1 Tax=Providencia rettgeri TaxID=587 RepID=UPI001B35CFBD|nr:hypothetical protein [Providencia rettgeri]MBQ0326253.1 hypothetical protein [Providencia rettgeri]